MESEKLLSVPDYFFFLNEGGRRKRDDICMKLAALSLYNENIYRKCLGVWMKTSKRFHENIEAFHENIEAFFENIMEF